MLGLNLMIASAAIRETSDLDPEGILFPRAKWLCPLPRHIGTSTTHRIYYVQLDRATAAGLGMNRPRGWS